jgi:hypothetical protein
VLPRLGLAWLQLASSSFPDLAAWRPQSTEALTMALAGCGLVMAEAMAKCPIGKVVEYLNNCEM